MFMTNTILKRLSYLLDGVLIFPPCLVILFGFPKDFLVFHGNGFFGSPSFQSFKPKVQRQNDSNIHHQWSHLSNLNLKGWKGVCQMGGPTIKQKSEKKQGPKPGYENLTTWGCVVLFSTPKKTTKKNNLLELDRFKKKIYNEIYIYP